jgi:uncharacterized protein YndB with AHSA1/START domain
MICRRGLPIKVAVLIVVVAVAAVLGFATTQPDSFRVERALAIKAPPAAVFALVNDFRAWARWSPWAHKDATMSESFSGATSGLGAVYTWSGNRDVGSGSMEIIDMTPPSTVRIRVRFLEPLATTNTMEFAFDGGDNYTEVTWTMDGPMPYVSKLLSVFTSMDALIGPDFELGLRNLKALSEY